MKTLTLLIALSLAACATTPCPVDSKPCPAPATCETACLHGYNLGCEWATPTPQGATCQTVCENAMATVPWNVSALTGATSCTP
jgi:hypothetical protein